MKEKSESLQSSPHILNTSSNLLGFTFLVLSSIKGLRLAQGIFIDKIISLCIVLFALSSFISFLSMRVKSAEKSAKYERVAEYIFLIGLLIVMIVGMLLAFDVIVLTR